MTPPQIQVPECLPRASGRQVSSEAHPGAHNRYCPRYCVLAGGLSSAALVDVAVQEVGMRMWKEHLWPELEKGGYASVNKYNESGEGVAIIWKKEACVFILHCSSPYSLQLRTCEGENIPIQPCRSRILRQAGAGAIYTGANRSNDIRQKNCI